MSKFGKESTTEEVLAGVDLTGKRILITGTTSGLGLETARAFAAHGADVVGIVRDLVKAQKASGTIHEAAAAGGGSLKLVQVDLGDLTSVRAGAETLLAAKEPLDVIIGNAGVLATPFELTADGFERQFATNHLGHFVLVNRVAPLLRDNGRLVMLSTVGHQQSNVDLDDPNFQQTPYDPFMASARSKTAVVQFAVEFDRRHKHRGIRAAAVHPGGVSTNVGRHLLPEDLEALFVALKSGLAAEGRELEMKTLSQGAATTVWAAVVASGDEVGGKYCEDCHVSRVIANDAQVGPLAEGVRAYAVDPNNARLLWERTEEFVGERFLS